MTWLKVSGNNNTCELCGEVIMFRQVYAPNAPTQLPITEFVQLLLPKLFGYIDFSVRFLLAAVSWVIVFPLFTSWWFKLCIAFNVDPFGTLKELPSELIAMTQFDPHTFASLLRWYVGVGLSVVILLVAHVIISIYTFLHKVLPRSITA